MNDESPLYTTLRWSGKEAMFFSLFPCGECLPVLEVANPIQVVGGVAAEVDRHPLRPDLEKGFLLRLPFPVFFRALRVCVPMNCLLFKFV